MTIQNSLMILIENLSKEGSYVYGSNLADSSAQMSALFGVGRQRAMGGRKQLGPVY